MNLLRMAEKDCRALQGMEDARVFSAEIFGFHVQQAVEKALKAWLCCLGATFPKIHDLDELGTLLEDAGQHIPESFAGLFDFTDFAVAFRYEAFPDLECDRDRRDTTAQVSGLLKHVQDILAHTAP